MTRLTQARIETLARAALMRHGASERQAEALAAGIAAAERDGLKSHGLMYLSTYCEHLICGKVLGQAEPRLTRPTPAVVAVDAANGFAHAAIALGLPALIEAARSQGVAALAIRNSYNCGALGYHTERIAQAGLVGLGFTNAPASIAPWGGRKAALGTNPWSLAVPDGQGGARFVIDQSASVVAKSEVMKRARAGEPIPPGWAFDASGDTTTDAGEALKGTMAPAGGYKGVGSALLVEIFAACLTGANPGLVASPFSGTAGGPPGTGQFFLAVSPDATSAGAFSGNLETIASAFVGDTRLPGTRRFGAREQNSRDGIEVAAEALAALERLAGTAA
ncbi:MULTISPECIES: Ldh family oxidoreductase [unclassified Mesorhizobium]|uniref:Ldh family oxidoreductase n=1 Tax=unclassified Mesorhizobium TaxID=325217 RepID=UPI001CD02E12|nr:MULTISPECIES: Ldh family oxidoreductase [unclassified Mesorhizobium]MBZ9734566.1 Ldh family oxidoreductase [Mesorhizobium sp. CA9]MBZ9812109.1 Ldh family oxidoreductase [Mesorhizobium sp. CA7]MBZ9826898.1 Ldh family oxidoreductase [Mesorhizobium sp. CA18]MBZ9832480.1 Ldh family oxidoreductase [Mesorhizobium sp. CA2]MBZ9838464.1 Ldh family oxidoreductase [Mesorhizobium sp. CA3]